MLMASVYFGMHTLGGRILVDRERFFVESTSGNFSSGRLLILKIEQ